MSSSSASVRKSRSPKPGHAGLDHGTLGDREGVSVRVFVPTPALRAFVTFYYFVEAFGPLTDFLYPEWGNVRLAISGDWRVINDPRDGAAPHDRVLFGPTDRRGQVVTGGGKTNELVAFMAQLFEFILPSLEFFNAGPAISTGSAT